jgi:hypothetical protein
VRLSTRPRLWLPPRSAFAGFRFPAEVIVVAVRWYLRIVVLLAVNAQRLLDKACRGIGAGGTVRRPRTGGATRADQVTAGCLAERAVVRTGDRDLHLAVDVVDLLVVVTLTVCPTSLGDKGLGSVGLGADDRLLPTGGQPLPRR